MTHQLMYIGGEWVDADEQYEIRSPATDELVATVAKGTKEHADRAVAAAKVAHEAGVWRRTRRAERAKLFREVAARMSARWAELSELQVRENGATRRIADMFHVGAGIAQLGYFADLAETYAFEYHGPNLTPVLAAGSVRREPVGVCAAIIPFNFPLALGTWKIGPALAAGNTIVVKPDERTPLLLIELVREFEAAGLPPGVLNLVTGDGAAVGAHQAQHPDLRKVAFTGSTAVGKEIMRAAASNVKKVTLELGGKAPNIVLADADLDTAVDGSLYGFLAFSGQACVSGTRLLLPSALHDEFVDRMVARVKTLKLGDPLDYSTDIGPVIDGKAKDRILGFIERAKADGATAVCGGGSPAGPGFDTGNWVEPTIFTNVTNDMEIAREEIFGPVLAVLRYDTVDEAIRIANDTEYGLSAGVWSTNVGAALDVANQLEAGSVWINDWHVLSSHYPFGGWKQSGLGREVGPRALDEYTEERFVSIDLSGGRDAKPYALVLSTPRG